MKYDAAKASAKWFLNANWFPFVIDSCRLQNADDWKVWKDEGDNYIRLTSDHKARIIQSSNAEKTTSDIYRFASPYEIARHSCWAVLSLDTTTSNHQLWFLGEDKRLRYLTYDNGKYTNVLPLLSGIKSLKMVAENTETISVNTNKNIITASTNWPPSALHVSIDPILKRLQNKHGW